MLRPKLLLQVLEPNKLKRADSGDETMHEVVYDGPQKPGGLQTSFFCRSRASVVASGTLIASVAVVTLALRYTMDGISVM